MVSPCPASPTTNILQETSGALFDVVDRQVAASLHHLRMPIKVRHTMLMDVADEELRIMEQLTGIDIARGRETQFAVAHCALAIAALLCPIERRLTV